MIRRAIALAGELLASDPNFSLKRMSEVQPCKDPVLTRLSTVFERRGSQCNRATI